MKTILVPMMMGRLEHAAIDAAIALAGKLDAQVDALVGLSAFSPPVDGWEYMPARPFDNLDEVVKATAENIAADTAQVLSNPRHTVRIADGFWLMPAEQTLEAARTADLIVLGRPDTPIDADDRLFGSILLGAGRPVLVVPASARRRLRFRRAAIAWRPTREAARAVHDAIPLLQRAQSVQIVRLLDAGEEAGANVGVDQDLVRHLERHGVQARFRGLRNKDASKGERILEFAREISADLIVAGGYGHARAFEQIFGGVTRTLFHKSPVPVFFSH